MEQNANYIYLQLNEEVAHDKPRILSASDDQSIVIYISDLTDEENNAYNILLKSINVRLNSLKQ